VCVLQPCDCICEREKRERERKRERRRDTERVRSKERGRLSERERASERERERKIPDGGSLEACISAYLAFVFQPPHRVQHEGYSA
jgi:hypothetical protein